MSLNDFISYLPLDRVRKLLDRKTFRRHSGRLLTSYTRSIHALCPQGIDVFANVLEYDGRTLAGIYILKNCCNVNHTEARRKY